MKILHRALGIWLPLVVLLSGVMLFAFVSTQQNYRQTNNDPQIQMAEDDASMLAKDYIPTAVVLRGAQPIDLATSLGTWTSVYDSSGVSLESSGVLDGAPPKLPAGLFDTTTWVAHKTWQAPTGPETRVTWQPRADVRQAVTLVQFKTPSGVGYVAVGRSMRLVEERIINEMQLFLAAWFVTAIAVLFAFIVVIGFGWL